jgi:START domain
VSRARAAALLLACLPWPCCASDWDLKIDDRNADIQVFGRVNDKGYNEFRAVTKVRSSLSAFVALFKDLDNMPFWAYRIEKAQRVKVVSDVEVYAYTINAMPAPLHDRDSVVRTTIAQDEQTLRLTFTGTGVPDMIPRDERYIRMPVVESSWTFTPIADGMVEVVFQGYGDPGGTLSSGLLAWFVRFSAAEAPYQTMLRMRTFVQRPEYQSARYSYVREPEPR